MFGPANCAWIIPSLVLLPWFAPGEKPSRIQDPPRPEHLARRTVRTPWIDLSRQAERRTIPNSDSVAKPRRAVPADLAGTIDTSGFPGARPGESALVTATSHGPWLCLVPERTGRHNALAKTSDDQGKTWSPLFELPAALTGTGYSGLLADGRLIIAFRDSHATSPTRGDVVVWIGTWADIIERREGAFTCRLLDDKGAQDTSGPVELIMEPDGSMSVTASVVLDEGKESVAVTVRFGLPDLLSLVPTRGYGIPLIDLNGDRGRHVVVDREEGQYLGHVTTCLLADGKTILAVYPKGHGGGAIVYKQTKDGGRTWSERLPTPESWATSKEVPTIHRIVDPDTGATRLILWSGLYPARLAASEDQGASWSELQPVGEWGGIVVMGFVERLADGSYLAMFHDDGRFFTRDGKRQKPTVMTLYKTFSRDGGRTWTFPERVWRDCEVHLCEPGCVRSPDGATLAVLLRENRRTRNSYVIFSTDEGKSWSPPRELPASLTGDRHTAKFGPDGRLFISFRDTTHDSPTQGDWVGWVGTWEDISAGTPGQYRVRLKDNKHRWDTTYPGVEVLADGTFVVTTYGHWEQGQQPYILSARFTLQELDERAGTSGPGRWR